jgi:hypothetical protein
VAHIGIPCEALAGVSAASPPPDHQEEVGQQQTKRAIETAASTRQGRVITHLMRSFIICMHSQQVLTGIKVIKYATSVAEVKSPYITVQKLEEKR